MPKKLEYDAVIVGSGPNGLAAAIRLAQKGLSVLLLEANDSIGGGVRSAGLTLPGFIHDVCSAIHPLGVASPFFRQLPLDKQGLKWIQPEFPLAHPFEDGTAAILQRSVAATAEGLGEDNAAYRGLFEPLTTHWQSLADEFLQPMLHIPRHPLQIARFGLNAMRSAAGLANAKFKTKPARALFAGLAAHSFLPLEQAPSAAFGLVLGMLAHAVGWPLPRGGAQQLANSLAACLRSLGGEIVLNTRVTDLKELPLARATLLDITPRQLLAIAGSRLPGSYRSRLEQYRYGPGVFKVDYALSRPVPWKAEACGRAGTVHLGGAFEEVARAEREVSQGEIPDKPFILFTQPSLFDSSRAPEGRHVGWAYCHVPNGSTVDMTERIENQIERFAPGFCKTVLSRHTMNCEALEQRNQNLVGGDINGGLADLKQLLARPILARVPYRVPVPGLYLCSSSTPPGGGVHGMCGYYAAEAALKTMNDE